MSTFRNILVSVFALCLIGNSALYAQQLYPGDVTNNGIVNNVDVLFWSYARGASGEARNNASSNWQAENLPSTLWADNFPGSAGTNYAYADCNGDGIVDQADLYVIIDNYHKTQPSGVQVDQFGQSAIQTAHSLEMRAQEPSTQAGATEYVDLYLVGQEGTVPTFYGTAFTLLYDPDFIADEVNQSKIDFTYDTGNDQNEWYAGVNKDEAAYFIWAVDDAGFAEVVLYNEDPAAAPASFGEIGHFSIVVEEVIFGLEVDTGVDLVIPYTVDKDFKSAGAASGEGTTFVLTGDAMTSGTEAVLSDDAVRFYPNPAAGNEVTVELAKQQAGLIQEIELLSLNGQLLLRQPFKATQATVSLEGVPKGTYLIKVIADGGERAYRLIKQ
ncbi:MAG TPA: T9SS type A sorting domain-containing protein [Phaeodactylibacter sp.]|nr:T9SS type A sorting domain-containing protein [Phaeodactylibacter sp.]